jgi:hypothetical protein
MQISIPAVVFTLLTASLPASASTLDGVWRSQGWGYIYRLRGADWQAFEVTSTTCVPGARAELQHKGSPGHEASFRTRDGGIFHIDASADQVHKRIVTPAGLSHIVIERLPKLPAACLTPTPDTPLDNFEVFTRTFAEHYIGFDLRHIEWEQRVAAQRRQITPQTSPEQLFDILKALLLPLTDIHTGLEASTRPKRQFDSPLRPGTDRIVEGDIDRFAKRGRRALAMITNRAFLRGRLVSLCRGEWQYGMTRDGIGYLRILSFGDYSRHGSIEDNLRALNSALDRILGNPVLKGLIIDVRLSFGGDDRLGLAIAARLTATPYLAYSIQARSHPTARTQFTPPRPVMVQPGRQPVFLGPVVELIGPITMSAAETFTQALMGRTPSVTRIGEPTQGVFCDILERRLPNGWKFALPNAVYLTAEGRAFDAIGVPPDLPVPVFDRADTSAGRDPAMAEAIRLLTKP